MTEKELKTLKEQIRNNKFYQQSVSPFKDFQFEQFSENGEILEGQHSRTEKINGKEVVVIFNFKNGLIHSDNDLPAIEYPMHWEYWNNGLITKVVDNGGETEEIWEHGIPVKINHNITEDLHYEKLKNLSKPVIDLQGTGLKIKQLRILKGLSVHDLQVLLDFEYPQAIYLWEAGKTFPTIENLISLSKIFEVDIQEIIVQKKF